MLEDRLQSDAFPADGGKNLGEGLGVTVRSDSEDVVEFLPGIPDPGGRRSPTIPDASGDDAHPGPL